MAAGGARIRECMLHSRAYESEHTRRITPVIPVDFAQENLNNPRETSKNHMSDLANSVKPQQTFLSRVTETDSIESNHTNTPAQLGDHSVEKATSMPSDSIRNAVANSSHPPASTKGIRSLGPDGKWMESNNGAMKVIVHSPIEADHSKDRDAQFFEALFMNTSSTEWLQSNIKFFRTQKANIESRPVGVPERERIVELNQEIESLTARRNNIQLTLRSEEGSSFAAKLQEQIKENEVKRGV